MVLPGSNGCAVRCDDGTKGDERDLVLEDTAVAPLRAQYAPNVCSPAYAGIYVAGDIIHYPEHEPSTATAQESTAIQESLAQKLPFTTATDKKTASCTAQHSLMWTQNLSMAVGRARGGEECGPPL